MLTIKEANKSEQAIKAAPAAGVMVELPKSWRPGRALSARKMAELAQALELVQARASVRLAEPGQVLAAVARAYEKAQEAGITWPALAGSRLELCCCQSSDFPHAYKQRPVATVVDFVFTEFGTSVEIFRDYVPEKACRWWLTTPAEQAIVKKFSKDSQVSTWGSTY